jgi:hypothetical protein
MRYELSDHEWDRRSLTEVKTAAKSESDGAVAFDQLLANIVDDAVMSTVCELRSCATL